MSDDVKAAVSGLMTAFEEFKTTNDTRLAAIEKKGAADVLVEEKLGRIEQTMASFEGLNQKVALAEQQQKALKEQQDTSDALLAQIDAKLKRPGAGGEAGERKTRVNDWGRAVVDAYTLGVANLSSAQQKVLAEVQVEYKALNVGTETAGGYLAPVEFVREITKAVTEISPVRSLARVRQTSLRSIQLPKKTGSGTARRTTEQGPKVETPGLAYGLDEIPAPEMYAWIEISNQLLEDSAFDMEAEIKEDATEQFAALEGREFVSGTGVGELQGFLNAPNVGTNNSGSATGIADVDGQADGLIALKYSLKTAYARNATWVMNRTTLGQARRLKDAEKGYIWQPGLALGLPNTIDGDPYVEMPDMPTAGAGAKPVAYGDFRRAYTVVDRISMEMLRDPYTQAANGNIRFILRKRVGGQIVLAEAIRTLTCAA